MSIGKNELVPTNNKSKESSNEGLNIDRSGRFQLTKDAPESIQTLFSILPERLKEKMVDRKEFLEWLKHGAVRTLEEITAGFDEKMKEKFVARCLSELFKGSAYKEQLNSVGIEIFDTEITRLADTIWRNRGKKSNEIELFNSAYYEQFSLLNKEIVSKIEAKKQEIAEIKARYGKLPKHKRLMRQGRFSETYNPDFTIKHKELDELLKQEEELDKKYGNRSVDKMYHRGITARRRNEQLWMESLAAVGEYCDPTEIATILAEELDNLFHEEHFMANMRSGAEDQRHTMWSVYKEEAKEKMATISEALRKWYEDHKFEGSLKQSITTTNTEREAKTITYFKNLMASYLRNKKDGQSDDEQNNTIRLMEVALTILSKD